MQDDPPSGVEDAAAHYLRSITETTVPRIEVLDIGAMPEGEERYTNLVDQGLARVTGFEPNPTQFEKLAGRTGLYDYLPVCLGDGGPATLNITRYPGCSSLLRPDERVIDAFSAMGATSPGGNFTVIDTLALQTTRLDDVENCPQPDLIKIDVQGAELLVLENGPNKVSNALVIETEVEFVPLYRNQPLFGDIQSFLRAQGFELHKLLDLAGRCYRPIELGNPFAALSQFLWADAIFVRSPFELELYSNDELLKTAVILNDVYRSYDLVLRLLRELDRRTNSRLSLAYGKFLSSDGVPPPLYVTLREDG